MAPGLDANRSEGVAAGEEASSCVVGKEAWHWGKNDLLDGMEGFEGMEFWEQVNQDPALWELPDETARVEEDPQEEVPS